MAMILGGKIARPKMFLLRSVTRSDDPSFDVVKRSVMIVKWRPSSICHLGFLDFPKLSGKRYL